MNALVGKSLLLSCVTLLLVLHVVCGDFSLTILHTNDVHARIEQSSGSGGRCSNSSAMAGRCYGGVARRMTAVRQLRQQHDNVLLLDGGDQFQGTTWFVVYQGDEAARFMSRVGYDAMTIGNHEFDLGPAALGRFMRNISFPVVSANTDGSREPHIAGQFSKSVVVTKGGTQIGIIGYTLKDTHFVSSPGDNVVFSEEVQAVREEASRLKAEGVNILIALGHSGIQVDQQVAANVPDIDVVVGGHTNTFLYTGTPPSSEQPAGEYPLIVTQASQRRVPVVQAFAYGKYLGELNLVFDDNGELKKAGGNPILLNSSVAEDPDVLAEVNEWKKTVDQFGQQEVGETRVHLNGERDTCRYQECNMGNIITDAMIHTSLTGQVGTGWTNASVAVWNGGGIRASIQQGKVIQNDVMTVLPFRNELTIIKLRGSDLRAALEYSVGQYGEDYMSGRFLQVSGLRTIFNVNKPSQQRVTSVRVRCASCNMPTYQPLDNSAIYNVITSNFLSNGGDGYTIFKERKLGEVYIGTLGSESLSAYMQKVSPVTHGLEDRIIVRTTDEQGCVTGGAAAPKAALTLTLTFLLKSFLWC